MQLLSALLANLAKNLFNEKASCDNFSLSETAQFSNTTVSFLDFKLNTTMYSVREQGPTVCFFSFFRHQLRTIINEIKEIGQSTIS